LDPVQQGLAGNSERDGGGFEWEHSLGGVGDDPVADGLVDGNLLPGCSWGGLVADEEAGA
jgi:hypothetical protein